MKTITGELAAEMSDAIYPDIPHDIYKRRGAVDHPFRIVGTVSIAENGFVLFRGMFAN